MIRSHDSCVPRKTKMLIIILLENRSRHYVNIRIVFVKVFVYLFILYIYVVICHIAWIESERFEDNPLEFISIASTWPATQTSNNYCWTIGPQTQVVRLKNYITSSRSRFKRLEIGRPRLDCFGKCLKTQHRVQETKRNRQRRIVEFRPEHSVGKITVGNQRLAARGHVFTLCISSAASY